MLVTLKTSVLFVLVLQHFLPTYKCIFINMWVWHILVCYTYVLWEVDCCGIALSRGVLLCVSDWQIYIVVCRWLKVVMECLGVSGKICTLQVRLSEVVPLPSWSVGKDSKSVFAWYVVSEPIFTSARRHFF